MPYVTTEDGTELYVKDWGTGRPVVLVHGWPLNADSWDAVSYALVNAGYRVIAYDRRGFGRSGQPWGGYDYDTFSDDLAAVMKATDVDKATLVGFSMGGGEIARYMSRHGGKGVAQAVLVGSVVPGLLRSDSNPAGAPPELFEQVKAGILKDRPQFFAGFFPDFYGKQVSEAVIGWSMQMMLMASLKATLACVDAWGLTDFTGDLPAFHVPTLVIHGTQDSTVPIEIAGRRAAAGIAGARLVEYEGGPHGLPASHTGRLVEDLLAFLATG